MSVMFLGNNAMGKNGPLLVKMTTGKWENFPGLVLTVLFKRSCLSILPMALALGDLQEVSSLPSIIFSATSAVSDEGQALLGLE